MSPCLTTKTKHTPSHSVWCHVSALISAMPQFEKFPCRQGLKTQDLPKWNHQVRAVRSRCRSGQLRVPVASALALGLILNLNGRRETEARKRAALTVCIGLNSSEWAPSGESRLPRIRSTAGAGPAGRGPRRGNPRLRSSAWCRGPPFDR